MGKRVKDKEEKLSFDERDSEFYPDFPFSREREKVPDRADEGAGSARDAFSGEPKRRCFITFSTLRLYKG